MRNPNIWSQGLYIRELRLSLARPPDQKIHEHHSHQSPIAAHSQSGPCTRINPPPLPGHLQGHWGQCRAVLWLCANQADYARPDCLPQQLRLGDSGAVIAFTSSTHGRLSTSTFINLPPVAPTPSLNQIIFLSQKPIPNATFHHVDSRGAGRF